MGRLHPFEILLWKAIEACIFTTSLPYIHFAHTFMMMQGNETPAAFPEYMGNSANSTHLCLETR